MSILNKLFSNQELSQDESDHNQFPSQWEMPISGKFIPLSVLPDQAFSEGMMGAGFAIKANEKTICSPVNGKVVSVFPGGHAFVIIADNGCELLIHVGIDSVGLKGEGFDLLIESGQTVKLKEPLLHVDFELLDKKLPDSSVIVVFTNIEEGEVILDNHRLALKD